MSLNKRHTYVTSITRKHKTLGKSHTAIGFLEVEYMEREVLIVCELMHRHSCQILFCQ